MGDVGCYEVNVAVKSTPFGSEISGYLFPAQPGFIRWHFRQESFCEGCGQVASGLGAALAFCKECDHKVVWAHAACLKDMALQMQTLEVAVHPDVQSSESVLNALSQAPSRNLATIPFSFWPAKSSWRREHISTPQDLDGPALTLAAGGDGVVANDDTQTGVEQEGRQVDVAPDAGTKRVLGVGTSDPVEPMSAIAADQRRHAACARKETKASDERGSCKASAVEKGEFAAGQSAAEVDPHGGEVQKKLAEAGA